MAIREGAPEAETIIAASVKVEGDFISQGNVLVEGMVEGKLSTSKDLRVGERARIAAEVSATNAVIAGEIRGNINVSERLELEPTAKVIGDIHTKVLTMAAGATVSGRVLMGAEAAEAAKHAKAGLSSVPKDEGEAKPAEAEKIAKPNVFGAIPH